MPSPPPSVALAAVVAVAAAALLQGGYSWADLREDNPSATRTRFPPPLLEPLPPTPSAPSRCLPKRGANGGTRGSALEYPAI